MLARERSEALPVFWEAAPSGRFLHTLTQFETAARPPPVRGGALFALHWWRMFLNRPSPLTLSLYAFTQASSRTTWASAKRSWPSR